jgi:hypothetical protein
MKITNLYNAPEAIARAVSFYDEAYDGRSSYLTASTAATPPRIVALRRQHWHEMEEDVADRFWRLFGSVVHTILERAAVRVIPEQRLFAEIDGVQISAQLDAVQIDQGLIIEYKFTSVWTAIFGGRSEWEEQMNFQAEVLARNGIEPRALQVVALFRDWQESRAPARRSTLDRYPLEILSKLTETPEDVLRERLRYRDKAAAGNGSDYPPRQWQVFDIPLWPQEKRVQWIRERIAAQQAAEEMGILPECSAADRWERYDKQLGKNRWVRCESYCPVARWCDQFAEYLANEVRTLNALNSQKTEEKQKKGARK